jgi:hypothetical protein
VGVSHNAPFLFGYSGKTDYTGGHCRKCTRRMDAHAKREIYCADCGREQEKELQRIEDCPLICDGDWKE